MKLSKNKRLRKLAVGLLRTFNPGTISIKNPFTGNKLMLDAYMHKGYWFRGKNVEKDTMNLFSRLINTGDTIIEVGAHIGLMAQYYSHIVGESGTVYVFEPAANNLVYLKKNIALSTFRNIVLEEKAVSETTGTAKFYVENITGQNSSLVADNPGPNSQKNVKDKSKVSVVEVPTVSLDDYVANNGISRLNFIKVDIESAELFAIKGMMNVLQHLKPRFMIEVSQNHEELYNILTTLGYKLFDVKKHPQEKLEYGNVFGVHKTDEAGLAVMHA